MKYLYSDKELIKSLRSLNHTLKMLDMPVYARVAKEAGLAISRLIKAQKKNDAFFDRKNAKRKLG